MKISSEAKIKALGEVGILTEEDLKDFSLAENRIYNLMADGEWHSASQIIAHSMQREGLRRLRSLRGKGFKIERKLPNRAKSREFWYRLSGNPKAQ